MADLFTLLQMLGDRIASRSDAPSSSSTQQQDEGEALEARFRGVLPDLLQSHFLPERVQEREILAILKLLLHTIANFPGVLFHGKPHSVLPIVARIVPLFAEPSASACRDLLFDVLCALLSLLSPEEAEIYRQFVIDAVLLVEDLVSVGSFYSTPVHIRGSSKLSVHCFGATLSSLLKEEADLFCLLPSCWDATNGGIIVDVTEKLRWEPFAEYTIKLLNYCLQSQPVLVRGLFEASSLYSVGSILCYGTGNLHKACFEFVRTAASKLEPDVVPCEKFIMSILTELEFSLKSPRISVYDYTLGTCLASLYAISQKHVVESTAKAFVDIFPGTLRTTSSRELKVALCSAMSVILNQCPSYGGSVLSFLGLIFIPDISSPLSCCLQLALDGLVASKHSTGEKEGHLSKRRKLNSEQEQEDGPFHGKPRVDYPQALQKVIGMLDAEMPLDSLLAGYSVLIRVLRRDSEQVYRAEVIKRFCSWLTSFPEKNTISMFHVSSFLGLFDIYDNLLLTQDMDLILYELKGVISETLKAPWLYFNQVENFWRAKLQVISIASRLTEQEFVEVDTILKLGLEDEDVRVKSAALASVPGLLSSASLTRLINICQMLRGMEEEKDQVRESLAGILGPMSCIYTAKRSLAPVNFRSQERRDVICSICDKRNGVPSHLLSGRSSWSFIDYWQGVIAKLLFDEASYRVQASTIRNLARFASHSSDEDLVRSKSIWLKCLEVFPMHHERCIREAFASQIHCFVEERFWRCIFDSGDNGDFVVLGKLRDALAVSKDPDVFETLMETVAEIAKETKGDRLQVFSVVVLMEQLDNSDFAVRVASLAFINEVAALRWPSDSGNRVDGLIGDVRKGLFEYLCGRLVSRPSIVKEFAEGVLQISLTDFLKQMIPVVLPKLVLEQQRDENALETLNSLAHQMKSTLPVFLVDWCHKVLSFLLLRADGKELMEALHFYEVQTGSDTRQIFAAVLPALLHELVWFLGDVGSDEALKRSARVAPMIKEVASIVSGSDDLSSFLKQHFVGLLNSIDRKLLRSEDTSCQKQALRCIERLLEMIGSHVSAFVPKIMALLSETVQNEALQGESFQVWFSFVKLLARVSPTSLKNIASQVVVALMPCLESEQVPTVNGAAKILEELVINCRSILDDQLRELPLLPSLSALAEVNAVLSEVRGSLNLREQLRRATDGLRHENLSLRYITATELLKVLSSGWKEVLVMALGEAPSDSDVIGNLVTALLRGCAEESRTSMSQKLKLACAECLGGLGAIDPVKLQVILRRRSRMEQKDEDFVFELINHHLVRVLRAASATDVQDAAALAIQELLKLTGCQSSSSTSSKGRKLKEVSSGELSRCGNRLWNRFSEDVKEILTPCLTSKYMLKISGPPIPSGPIFRPGISFRRWMSLWVRRLISQVTGQRSSIFAACQGIIRHDMDTALYLLPYLILDVLHDDSVEARSAVTEEILAVLHSETISSKDGSGQPVFINNTFFGHGEVSIQAIFMLLDNLGQWVDDYTQGAASIQNLQSTKRSASTAQQKKDSLQCELVGQLLSAIPKKSLTGASLRCGANARALLYYESYVREKSGAFNPAAITSGVFEDEDIAYMLQIYGGLQEPDGLSGLARLQTSPSLQDQALINEKSGNWAEVLSCCEQALQMEPKSLAWQTGVLDCLVNMGHFQAMATHVDGLIGRMPEHKREWSIRGVQAAWRLGQWDLLNEYVQGAELETGTPYSAESDAVFDLGLAKILQALRSKEHNKFAEQVMRSRLALLTPLAAACMESYTRAYPVIVKLHMLRELEDFFALSGGNDEHGTQSNNITLPNMVENWNGRLKMTQPSLWVREPILALRRILFSSTSMQSEVETCWLQYAKLCRSSGHYETANRAILQAQAAGASNTHKERAKLLWDTKSSQRALEELQLALAKIPLRVLGDASDAVFGGVLHKTREPAEILDISTAAKADTAKALLLLGRWAHQTGQMQKEAIISIYTRVKDMEPAWEKGYFYMAKYYDDLLADAKKRQEETQEARSRGANAWGNYLADAMLYYAKTLHRSHHHLFQALPRLLTLWFEFGSLGADSNLKARVMSIIRSCLKDLPAYQWLAALPQLVSRICHNNEEVVRMVKIIITGVLRAYPQQALWTMAAVSRSAVPQRKAAATEIIDAAKSATPAAEKHIFTQFATLIDQMINLSFASVDKDKVRFSLSTSELGALKRTMPLGVIMPVQRALTLNLPAVKLRNANYNPFPSGDCVTIEAIRDQVEVLISLQRPKKVILVASDGTEHPFLCKPKDDLRKDARMMEFTSMINRLLSKDPSSRRRKLYMRTFSVIPLSEDCGMVEWVLHTRGIRNILQDLYMACGKLNRKTNPMIKKLHDEKKLSGPELLQKILPMFPPVFHRWFLNTFPEPTAWFQARLAYAHTAAVWSMVGHIVGLGDRHGENIMMDSTTGDCVHVDFSCLFDKGLLLEKPELVPFRLTQNMVDGLGITGYEGVFLRTCEITLSVLRSNRETLMSVLETFIHDPLVEWTKSHKRSSTEVQNPHAQRALGSIEARLQGVVVGVGAAPSLPLSVEGQAHRLIAEAVCHENLGRMFIWWMAWY